MTSQKKKCLLVISLSVILVNTKIILNFSGKEQLHPSQWFSQNPKGPLGSYLLQPSGLVSEGPSTVSMNVATLENPAGNSSHSSNLMPLPKE